jgi:predicted amidophosphoribosyltransferase
VGAASGAVGCCPPCPAARAAFASAFAPVAHAGPARDLILALKLRGALPAADAMAAHILARAPAGLFDDAVLVPVPGRADRRRRRGFDPAERLAAALGRRVGRPVAAWLLQTPQASTRQLGRGRAERLGPADVRVAGVAPTAVSPVLIDDVHTTGATLDSSARALKRAGFRQIGAVSYARTLTKP